MCFHNAPLWGQSAQLCCHYAQCRVNVLHYGFKGLNCATVVSQCSTLVLQFSTLVSLCSTVVSQIYTFVSQRYSVVSYVLLR